MADYWSLQRAVKDEDLGKVQRLLSQGLDIGKEFGLLGINSLHLAVLTGNYDIFELLSRDEAHINSHCSYSRAYCKGYTPLHFSVYICNKNITQLLLSRNANVNKQTENGSTPLHIAARHGYLFGEIKLDLLLKDFRWYSQKYSDDILHGITKGVTVKEFCDITDILLQSGANAHLVNEFEDTALHVACQLEDDTMARRILKNCRSIVNYKNRAKKTALHIAANSYYNNKGLVKLLIEYGADIDATDCLRSTPLNYACLKRKLDVVRILVENGCNVNKGGNYKPINVAVSNCDFEILKLLFKHGAGTSHVDSFFYLRTSCFEIIDYEIILFETCCEVFFKTYLIYYHKWGDFNTECIFPHFEVFKLLLQHACFKNIDRKTWNFRGNTIFTSFVKYVIKMKTLECFFARDYPDIDSSNIDLLPDEKEYKENCKLEVEILMRIFVCSDISLLVFLKKDLNKMVRLLKNQEIVNVLECFNYNKFPIYGEFIKKFFELGMERRSTLNQLYECFNVIFCQFPELPELVVENIFDVFTTNELKKLRGKWGQYNVAIK